MAIIYQFPDLNVEGYPEFNAEEINRQYEEYYQWERDEYLYNQLLKEEQEQNEQRKRQICLANRFVQKIISFFH
ncbi:MAG: hypothetical protein APF81_17840 [Desulfosporosinus sp. BRH_c37]|nr:MAG: hypothetical protein APF81_17840 [Desulfosporosinus sp. BRH_c37]